MGFIDVIKAKAKADKKVIVLPETEDKRTYEAAEAVLKEGTANLILVGSKEEIEKNGAGFDLTGAVIVDPATDERTAGYIAKLVELRQKKGMTEEQAKEILLTNYLYYGVMMVKMGDADGMVSGACHSTADTLRPCLQILKTKPGTKLVSAFFVMVVPDCEMGEHGTFIFGDSGLEQNPDPEKLAAIAISSAESFRTLVGAEPKVAMLSHSTKGSAKHADVDKVVEATKIANNYFLCSNVQAGHVSNSHAKYHREGDLTIHLTSVLDFPELSASDSTDNSPLPAYEYHDLPLKEPHPNFVALTRYIHHKSQDPSPLQPIAHLARFGTRTAHSHHERSQMLPHSNLQA